MQLHYIFIQLHYIVIQLHFYIILHITLYFHTITLYFSTIAIYFILFYLFKAWKSWTCSTIILCCYKGELSQDYPGKPLNKHFYKYKLNKKQYSRTIFSKNCIQDLRKIYTFESHCKFTLTLTSNKD